MENLFILATRNKVRFAHKGLLSVEDLWDLPVEQLDSIFKSLNRELKTSSEDSLLQKRTAHDEVLALQVEIVKFIVGVKLEEAEAKKNAATRLAQKRKIKEILAQKQDESLLGKSEEELVKMLDEL